MYFEKENVPTKINSKKIKKQQTGIFKKIKNKQKIKKLSFKNQKTFFAYPSKTSFVIIGSAPFEVEMSSSNMLNSTRSDKTDSDSI